MEEEFAVYFDINNRFPFRVKLPPGADPNKLFHAKLLLVTKNKDIWNCEIDRNNFSPLLKLVNAEIIKKRKESPS